MHKTTLLPLLLLVVVLDTTTTGSRAQNGEENIGPIVGIFAQPSKSKREACGGHCQYIAASYVKWVESAGGRVVPIPYNASTEYLDYLFTGLNGVLFPGGSKPIPYAAKYVVDRALAANDAGDYFPVWAICLGMEWLMKAIGGDNFKLDGGYDAENISLPLDFTEAAFKSRLFATASPELLKILQGENVTMNNHHYGASPSHFTSTKGLNDFFTVLSTNTDRQGAPFVSTVESKQYPVWGLQWHPEKNVYEWGENEDGTMYEAINHSPNAQLVTKYMAEFFINQARKNIHQFPTAEDQPLLMYNYSPVYSGPEFEQSYYFHFTPETSSKETPKHLRLAKL